MGWLVLLVGIALVVEGVIGVAIGGLAAPVLGVDRARALMEWFAAHGSGAIRIAAIGAILGGAFVAYAARGSNAKAL